MEQQENSPSSQDSGSPFIFYAFIGILLLALVLIVFEVVLKN